MRLTIPPPSLAFNSILIESGPINVFIEVAINL